MNSDDQTPKSGDNSSGNSPASENQGWAYPWGYHLPCFTTVNSADAHTCDKTKRYGNFIVNEGASHFEN